MKTRSKGRGFSYPREEDYPVGTSRGNLSDRTLSRKEWDIRRFNARLDPGAYSRPMPAQNPDLLARRRPGWVLERARQTAKDRRDRYRYQAEKALVDGNPRLAKTYMAKARQLSRLMTGLPVAPPAYTRYLGWRKPQPKHRKTR
jgi:hypothetical protein